VSDARDLVRREMGLLERIASYIPGYRGYKEKELRREADALVRRRAAEHLRGAKAALSRPLPPSRMRAIASDRDLSFGLEEVRNLLDRVTSRIDKAVHGYAGLFDAVKVREERLDAVYQHDLKLIEKAAEIERMVSDFPSLEPEQMRQRLQELRRACAELDAMVDERSMLLRGLTEV